MGEKRILCTKVSGECRCFNEVKEDDLWTSETDVPGCYCCRNNGWERITKDKCKSCTKAEYEGITRERAIEKMAKALCKMDYTDCSGCSGCAFKDKPKECKSFLKDFDFYEQAEAALDALLGGHDD